MWFKLDVWSVWLVEAQPYKKVRRLEHNKQNGEFPVSVVFRAVMHTVWVRPVPLPCLQSIRNAESTVWQQIVCLFWYIQCTIYDYKNYTNLYIMYPDGKNCISAPWGCFQIVNILFISRDIAVNTYVHIVNLDLMYIKVIMSFNTGALWKLVEVIVTKNLHTNEFINYKTSVM